MGIIRKHWPLVAAITILWLAVAALFAISVKQNEGHIVYTLDDPYIHMAIAKNLAQYGVWGVTRYEFTPSSSSPLWGLILFFIYLIFGANEVSPLILNITFATLIVFSVYWILRRCRRSYIFLILLGIIFFTPLPPLIFTGHEHILHALITILFVYLSAKVLSEEYPVSSASRYALVVLTPLLASVRYEGLFLVFVACILFASRKQWLYSFLLGALAIVPVGVYGIISINHGWFWLPTPVFIKGYVPELTSLQGIMAFFSKGYVQLLLNYHILFLIIAALVLYALCFNKEKGAREKNQVCITLFVATAFLHMQFARTGWFYRYEAYLVAAGLFVIASALLKRFEVAQRISINKSSIPKYAAITILAILFMRPLSDRGIAALINTPQATKNIYEQQYQMGLFLREFYKGAPVVANDAGAINYLADIKYFDVWGFNNLGVAKMIRKGYYGRKEIYDAIASSGAKIAVVYDRWFEMGIESSSVHFYKLDTVPQWAKVGEWKILNNKVCGADVVSFYAVDLFERDNLIANLKKFAPRLPASVKQSGEYTE